MIPGKRLRKIQFWPRKIQAIPIATEAINNSHCRVFIVRT
jgi:hypothetical protein